LDGFLEDAPRGYGKAEVMLLCAIGGCEFDLLKHWAESRSGVVLPRYAYAIVRWRKGRRMRYSKANYSTSHMVKGYIMTFYT